jgi:predicted metal-dependent hydrolase
MTTGAEGRGLAYTLVRSRRRTMSVEVHPHGDVIVRCPHRMPLSTVETFLRVRVDWILSKLEGARDSRLSIPPLPDKHHTYVRGSVVRAAEVYGRSQGGMAERERTHAMEVFGAVIGDLLPGLGVGGLRYRGFTIRKMRRRWGSCRSDGFITLNQYLLWTPDVCIKAVVAHELAHVVHLDHSSDFHTLARQLMPEYDDANELLDRWTSVLPRPETRGGTQGPAEQRIMWLSDGGIDGNINDHALTGHDDATQISSNALTNAPAISSAIRPSM